MVPMGEFSETVECGREGRGSPSSRLPGEFTVSELARPMSRIDDG